MLQASDVESLLEQFEASEVSMPCKKTDIKKNSTKVQQVTKKEDQSNVPKKSRRTCMPQKTSPPQEVIDRIKVINLINIFIRYVNRGKYDNN